MGKQKRKQVASEPKAGERVDSFDVKAIIRTCARRWERERGPGAIILITDFDLGNLRYFQVERRKTPLEGARDVVDFLWLITEHRMPDQMFEQINRLIEAGAVHVKGPINGLPHWSVNGYISRGGDGDAREWGASIVQTEA